MRYEGHYDTLEKPIKSNSLLQVQEHIENLGGYESNKDNCCFKEYETAWIMEYNFIGRLTAQYYFSMKDKSWHRSQNKITMYSSWQNAVYPVKVVAQWVLKQTGHKSKDEKFINDFIQKSKIDELYGK